ncbi:MAG: hypothetical protein Fur0010_05850 [Bdellovibrio sp.]
MKVILVVLLISLQNANASCLDYMKGIFKKNSIYNQTNEMKLLKEIEQLERQTNFIRKLKDNPEPAIILSMNSRLAKMDAFLLNEQFSIPYREWRPLFRELEFSYVVVSNNEKALKILEKLNPEDGWSEVEKVLKRDGFKDEQISLYKDLFEQRKNLNNFKAALQFESNERQVRIGSLYQEYTMIREHLEDLLSGDRCNQKCKNEITTMLNRLGLGDESDKLRYIRLVGDSKRPSLEDLRKVMQTYPLISVTRLKKERAFEVMAAIRDLLLQPAMLSRISKSIYNLPGINRSRLVRLFKVAYDYQARVLYFPDINQVVRSTKEVAEKYNYLRELNSAVDGDELIVTFARRIDHHAKTTWKQLSKHAESNDPDFFKRMAEAEVKAKARGDISLTVEQSAPAKLAALLFAGGAIGYYYFDKESVTQIFSSTPVEPTESLPPSSHIGEISPNSQPEELIDLKGEEEEIIEDAAKFLIQQEEIDLKGKTGWIRKNKVRERFPAKAK